MTRGQVIRAGVAAALMLGVSALTLLPRDFGDKVVAVAIVPVFLFGMAVVVYGLLERTFGGDP